MNIITNKDELIDAVGNAMENYINEFSAGWYIDYTDQTVVMIEDYIFELDEDKKSDVQWEKDMIDIVKNHQLERIDNPSDEVKRQVMMSFAEMQPDKNTAGHLRFSIIQQQEFASFDNVVRELRLERLWAAFRADEYRRIAKKWVKKKRFDFVEGRLVRRTD